MERGNDQVQELLVYSSYVTQFHTFRALIARLRRNEKDELMEFVHELYRQTDLTHQEVITAMETFHHRTFHRRRATGCLIQAFQLLGTLLALICSEKFCRTGHERSLALLELLSVA